MVVHLKQKSVQFPFFALARREMVLIRKRFTFEYQAFESRAISENLKEVTRKEVVAIAPEMDFKFNDN